ncbi:hypothetical protein Fot_47943 [Forsythia ovata]|uniref:Uncharacterized protein n=1 Tax=Forsythia ovata TaxID=205694 RepID=A0ABD1QVH1_9LAMI
MSEAAVDISFALPPEELLLPSENVRRSDKEKMVINDEEEKTMPKKGMEDEDSVRDSQKAKHGRETPLRRAGENTLHPRNAIQTSIHPSIAGSSASISGLFRMN